MVHKSSNISIALGNATEFVIVLMTYKILHRYIFKQRYID